MFVCGECLFIGEPSEHSLLPMPSCLPLVDVLSEHLIVCCIVHEGRSQDWSVRMKRSEKFSIISDIAPPPIWSLSHVHINNVSQCCPPPHT